MTNKTKGIFINRNFVINCQIIIENNKHNPFRIINNNYLAKIRNKVTQSCFTALEVGHA